ncbi:CU044_2847 family protein [Micromonospora aurantiaca (nom. illeg.)]|uniref:CU044_2847 family protein n=1 Tax=Micromonospora aurantiaca (nom. illeg.) TaxID=47850 RepID=UPI0037B7643E
MSEIHVQVVPRGDTRGDLAGGRLIENLKDRINELGDSIMEVSGRLQERLAAAEKEDSSAGWRLAEAQITFSLDLEAEAGVIVSRTSASASFEVSLSWSRE